MKISDSLELLNKARTFEVKENGGCYEVTFKDMDDSLLSAMYDEEHGWSYYIGGVYNCGCDWVEVDVNKLKALMEFCDSLGGAR